MTTALGAEAFGDCHLLVAGQLQKFAAFAAYMSDDQCYSALRQDTIKHLKLIYSLSKPLLALVCK